MQLIYVLGLLLPQASSGQTIQIKNSFWEDWKYSTDRVNFFNVGSGARDLREIMLGDSAATKEMNSFVARRRIANVTAVVGGGVMGWSMYRAVITKQWDSTSQLLLFAGAPITLLSVGVRFGAAGDLKHAVKIFNTNHKPRESPPTATLTPVIFKHGEVGLGFSLRF